MPINGCYNERAPIACGRPNAVHKALVSFAETIRSDFQVIFEKDPAARSWLEVLFCYPGLHAIVFHRMAHLLYNRRMFLSARMLAHLARGLTGIEIHPGATIGRGIFIDHGMGVVIGETAIIGDNALIYQGVTIGGTGKEKGKRHPTLGYGVVVGAGAKVLGNIEVGNNSRIGAGSVVLRTVPSDCTVVGVPGRVVYQDGERIDPLAHGQIPDPVADVVRNLIHRLDELEAEVQQLRAQNGQISTPSCSVESRLIYEEFLHGGSGI